MEREDSGRRDSLGEAIGLQMRDLLLRFPCAVVEGVRWSSLCRAYRERFPDAPNPSGTHPCSSAGISMRAWLADVAESSEDSDNSAELWFRLRDAVALTPGSQGQLACWPLLVQRLGEIVRTHGVLQPPEVGSEVPATTAGGAAATPSASGSKDAAPKSLAASSSTKGDVDRVGVGDKSVGVLLAQLKPLLRRHWDPAFEEKAVGYYNEFGNYVSVKKMKHLIAELLKWRAKRRSQNRGSAVDAALLTPLVLVTSPRNNDMVLCSPILYSTPSQVVPLLANRVVDQIGSAPAKVFFAHCGESESSRQQEQLQKLQQQQKPEEKVASPTNSPKHNPKARTASDPQRLETAERDAQRLRIENAELKKRVRFGADFLYKEIRRLRIENAELKKRLYPSGQRRPGPPGTPASAPSGDGVGTPNAGACQPVQGCMPMQAVWVPVMTQPGGMMTPPAAAAMMPSGTMSPVPQGFCYAMPVSPQAGHTWGNQMMAIPMGIGTPAGSVDMLMQSPGGSDRMRLLPADLLSGNNSLGSQGASGGGVSPAAWIHGQAAASMIPMQFTTSDDRWACIPQGIVEEQKAVLEESELPLGGRVREGDGEEAPARHTPDGSSDDDEPLVRSRSY